VTGFVKVAMLHDGERAWALEISQDAADMLRAFLQAHAQLAAAMQSLAETEIARAAVEFHDGSTVSEPQRPASD